MANNAFRFSFRLRKFAFRAFRRTANMRRATTSYRSFSPSSVSTPFLGYSEKGFVCPRAWRVVFAVLLLSYRKVFEFGAVALLKRRDVRTKFVCKRADASLCA